VAERGAPASREGRLGAAGLIGLLVAALVLGVYVYRARTPDLALEVPGFERELDNEGKATLQFFVRFDEPDATLEIVGRNQVLARTLEESIALHKDQRITCVWDATDDEGEKVEPGRYRLRVTLPEQDRVMVFPRRIDVQPGARTPGHLSVPDPCGDGGDVP
jgi:hypothetical protein